MRTSSPRFDPPLRSTHQGVALVIVLAFVVLLAGLVLAYFSRVITNRQLSDSSFNQAKTDELARSALAIITSNLKQEIANGSTAITQGGTTIYTPTNNFSMVPVQNGVPTASPTPPIPTLIRTSTTNSISAPGVDFPASNALSSTPSANGKSISAARWNKHYLIPRPPGATRNDTTPIAEFTVPSWIYVTDQGPTKLTSPDPAVIGRYAYAIYDEGALLDANVAGYPSALPADDPHPLPDPNDFQRYGYARKGSVAFADLSALGMSATDIDNLVGWRNFASAQPSGSFSANFTFDADAAGRYYDSIRSSDHGYVRTSPTSWTPPGGSGPRTDQQFLTRQELIKFCQSTSSGLFSEDALQYLGTFSRALTAPSWLPTENSEDLPGFVGGSGLTPIDYKDSADDLDSINRNLANVRWANAATITHYDDDGATTTYNVQAGDPMLQRRFSLAKLAWFTPSGPATGKAQAIEDCFGLQWNSAKWRWDYVAAKDPPGVAIKTLDQVAAEDREPNFFEILNAGILNGSLGRDPGPGMDAAVAGGVGVFASYFDQYKSERNLQILQIGANIIDQYDADSYPTAVHLTVFPGMTAADDLSIQTLYGIENLPYLTGLFPIAIADPVPPGAGATGELKFWLQPQLWNPHQVPQVEPTDYPSGFRVYAYGKIFPVWSTDNNASSGSLNFGPSTSYDDGTGTQGTAGRPGEVYFIDPGDATSPFYNNPVGLSLDLTTSVGIPVVDQINTPAANYYDASKWSNLEADGGTPNEFAGIALAGDPTYNPDPSVDRVYRKLLLPDTVSTAYFALQYKGPDGAYHPYNFMARLTQDQEQWQKHMKPSPEVDEKDAGGVTIVPHTTVVGQTKAGGWGPARLDPRTDRFSASTQWWGQNSSRTRTMNPGQNSHVPPQGSGASGTGSYSIPFLPNVFRYFPAYDPPGTINRGNIELFSLNDPAHTIPSGLSAGNNAYYADPDGVVRYGDSYRSNISSGDGRPMYAGSTSVSPTSSITNVRTGSAQARRSAILNRPFHSVGELGFAYRDLPYKTLDFWSPTSADGALLDLFSTTDQPAIVAGQVSLNNAPAAVVEAILAGGNKTNDDPDLTIYNSDTNLSIQPSDAVTLAEKIVSDLRGANGPYMSRADLAARLAVPVTTAFDTTTSANANWANKPHSEAPMRALADVTNTRTWNLLVDVIAQSGTFRQGANDLEKNFAVRGECRYWLHIAIDRYTGKVVDQQLEPVYE